MSGEERTGGQGRGNEDEKEVSYSPFHREHTSQASQRL